LSANIGKTYGRLRGFPEDQMAGQPVGMQLIFGAERLLMPVMDQHVGNHTETLARIGSKGAQ
jgi:hypothetical protein